MNLVLKKNQNIFVLAFIDVFLDKLRCSTIQRKKKRKLSFYSLCKQFPIIFNHELNKRYQLKPTNIRSIFSVLKTSSTNNTRRQRQANIYHRQRRHESSEYTLFYTSKQLFTVKLIFDSARLPGYGQSFSSVEFSPFK